MHLIVSQYNRMIADREAEEPRAEHATQIALVIYKMFCTFHISHSYIMLTLLHQFCRYLPALGLEDWCAN